MAARPVALHPRDLLDRALGTITTMAQAMWNDDVQRRAGKSRTASWDDETDAEREVWMRRATVAFMTMLEPKA